MVLSIETTQFTSTLQEINLKMDETYTILSIFEIGIALVVLIISFVVTSYFINKLIKPIILLTKYAQMINRTTHYSKEESNNNNLKEFDIDSIKVLSYIYYLRIIELGRRYFRRSYS